MNSYEQFKMIHQKNTNDKVLLTNLKKVSEVQPKILIPLSDSLYVKGKIKSKDLF